MKKIALILAFCMIIIFGLSACGGNSTVPETDIVENSATSDASSQKEEPSLPSETDISEADASESAPNTAETVSRETADATDIVIIAEDIVITATLDNSETTEAFLATLPRTLTMNRYGEREYYGRIETISENGESISDFENGDVTYYPAGPSFAIFFDGEDSSSQGGLIRMGKITSDLSVFDALGETVKVQIELEQ